MKVIKKKVNGATYVSFDYNKNDVMEFYEKAKECHWFNSLFFITSQHMFKNHLRCQIILTDHFVMDKLIEELEHMYGDRSIVWVLLGEALKLEVKIYKRVLKFMGRIYTKDNDPDDGEGNYLEEYEVGYTLTSKDITQEEGEIIIKAIQRQLTNYLKNRGLSHKTWSNNVLVRDNFKCVVCGNENNLHAHHIKSYKEYPQLREDVSNGETLCKKCHLLRHANKEAK